MFELFAQCRRQRIQPVLVRLSVKNKKKGERTCRTFRQFCGALGTEVLELCVCITLYLGAGLVWTLPTWPRFILRWQFISTVIATCGQLGPKPEFAAGIGAQTFKNLPRMTHKKCCNSR